ncbi:hypothetical protein LZ31DRAFT_194270 [Colletotrichum somersetense]|nr:hypothetical protein LZ31DRAFT_194270 [Colletotrichum somersetense]
MVWFLGLEGRGEIGESEGIWIVQRLLNGLRTAKITSHEGSGKTGLIRANLGHHAADRGDRSVDGPGRVSYLSKKKTKKNPSPDAAMIFLDISIMYAIWRFPWTTIATITNKDASMPLVATTKERRETLTAGFGTDFVASGAEGPGGFWPWSIDASNMCKVSCPIICRAYSIGNLCSIFGRSWIVANMKPCSGFSCATTSRTRYIHMSSPI